MHILKKHTLEMSSRLLKFLIKYNLLCILYNIINIKTQTTNTLSTKKLK